MKVVAEQDCGRLCYVACTSSGGSGSARDSASPEMAVGSRGLIRRSAEVRASLGVGVGDGKKEKGSECEVRGFGGRLFPSTNVMVNLGLVQLLVLDRGCHSHSCQAAGCRLVSTQ